MAALPFWEMLYKKSSLERMIIMKKKFLSIILVFVCILLSGCNGFVEHHTGKPVVDTSKVLEYTDGLMEQMGHEPIKRSISQHTDGVTFFVVEYWFRENNAESHYGFYIQETDGYYEVLQEGRDISRDLIE